MIDHTDDITHREQRTKRELLPFALAILAAVIIWLAFTHYL